MPLLDPFGRVTMPAAFDREGRVRLLGEAADALVEGRPVGREAGMFLGAALLAWLQQGGRLGALERDFLKVVGPQRSRLTPARLWQRNCASTATADESDVNVSSTMDDHN